MYREHLNELIGAEAEALARLEDALDAEHELIRSNELAKLDLAGDVRQACIANLTRVQEERRSLCRMLDLRTDSQGIEKLLVSCDPSRELQRQWSACTDRARRCHDANERNGALVKARLKGVTDVLGLLTQGNGPAAAPLYSATGATQNLRAGRLLATKA